MAARESHEPPAPPPSIATSSSSPEVVFHDANAVLSPRLTQLSPSSSPDDIDIMLAMQDTLRRYAPAAADNPRVLYCLHDLMAQINRERDEAEEMFDQLAAAQLLDGLLNAQPGDVEVQAINDAAPHPNEVSGTLLRNAVFGAADAGTINADFDSRFNMNQFFDFDAYFDDPNVVEHQSLSDEFAQYVNDPNAVGQQNFFNEFAQNVNHPHAIGGQNFFIDFTQNANDPNAVGEQNFFTEFAQNANTAPMPDAHVGQHDGYGSDDMFVGMVPDMGPLQQDTPYLPVAETACYICRELVHANQPSVTHGFTTCCKLFHRECLEEKFRWDRLHGEVCRCPSCGGLISREV